MKKPGHQVKINLLLITIGLSLILSSCSKNGVKPPTLDSTKLIGKTTAGAGIYIGGYESTINANGQTFQVAKIWKDGKATALTDGTHDAAVQSVFVTATDVYAVGYKYLDDDQTPIATLWKNGVATALATTYSQANGVFVSGNDVYVCGNVQAGHIQDAVVWKNGVVNSLPSIKIIYGTVNIYAYANSIYVSGDNVYVSGVDSTATIWHNGIPGYLPGGTFSSQRETDEANNVYVSGSDVFAAGSVNGGNYNNVAVIWKNGGTTELTSKANSDGIAYGVYANGASVYAVGEEKGTNGDANFIAKYWKNGTGNQISTYAGTKLSSYESQANAIAGSGADTYILWDDSKDYNPGAKFTIKLWKNGVSTPITDGTNQSHGASLFIKN
jgi:hypothetical protein